MKIVLFNPRHFDNSNGKINVAAMAVNLPPLGIMSIAAVLRNAGHEVKILDSAAFYKIQDNEWIEKIIAFNPDFIGFSVITPTFWHAYNIATVIKEKKPDIKTVFGGVHVSWGRELILENFKNIDYIIAGEGEFALKNLLDGKNPQEIPGLYFREDDQIKYGPPQTKKTLCKMDELPFPAYDLVEGFPEHYNMALFSYTKKPTASIISSRGCVYKCSYCDRSVFHQSFRWNSPEYTFEQIKWLNKTYRIKHIMFYDDLFTLNRNRVSKLCEYIRKSNLKIKFNCIVRIGHIDKELIDELKSAGCWQVHVGIESGDQNILDKHKEKLSLDDIRRDINYLYKRGLWVKGLFMMGFPGETIDSIKKTINFATSLPLKDVNLTAFTPYPGAPIYNEIHNHGYFDDSFENWKNMDCVKFVFVPKEIGDKKILEKYYGEFLTKFYNRPFMWNVYNRMLLESPDSYIRIFKGLPYFLKYLFSLKK